MGAPTGYSSQAQLNVALGSTATQQQALYNQQLMNRLQSIHARQPEAPRWMVDGRSMSFDDFVQTVFPEDTPERTFFLLKYKK